MSLLKRIQQNRMPRAGEVLKIYRGEELLASGLQVTALLTWIPMKSGVACTTAASTSNAPNDNNAN
jgi:hypothetical protein